MSWVRWFAKQYAHSGKVKLGMDMAHERWVREGVLLL